MDTGWEKEERKEKKEKKKNDKGRHFK
jgi:hypothetical protein